MERSLHNENFEKLLKENADQFRMTPSKKVWHGIYNDLHPGRRWPSIAITFLFLFTLVVIGHLNTNNSYKNSLAYNVADDEATADNAALKTKSHKHSKQKRSSDRENNIASQKQNNNDIAVIASADNTGKSLLAENFPLNNQIPLNNQNYQTTNSNNSSASNVENSNSAIANRGSEKSDKTSVSSDSKNQKTNTADRSNDKSVKKTESVTELKIKNSKLLAKVDKAREEENKNTSVNETKSEEGAGNFQFKLKKSKMNWVYYITPTLSYRTRSGSDIPASSVTLGAAAPNSVSNEPRPAVNHPAMGVEFGGEVTYEISKRLRFIGGVQLNYSRYTVEANYIHPVTASLLLNSDNINMPYVLTATSQYGNRTNSAEVTLQNYSFQASMPIGLQYKIGGNNNIEVNAAATIQPSFVISSKGYLLSSDKRNFITDPSLSRKWNMSSNFGTFITFKANSFTWQIGPRVRYQWLSAYTANYPQKEHLLDFGVRFGVTKTLK